MPSEQLNVFLDSFRSLKLRVLWKCDLTDLKNQPPNVLMRSWMPQTDILAHKNVRLFITHGGLFGTTEGTSRGVPMLFMPVFGDQFRNAAKTVQRGYGLILHRQDVTKARLTEKIETLVYDKQYSQRAKEVSNIFNDNLVHPMDQAIYWIEYVARHKGAPHLKSAAIEMSFFEYYSLDVYGALIVLPVILIALVLKMCCCACRSAKSDKVKPGKKKN